MYLVRELDFIKYHMPKKSKYNPSGKPVLTKDSKKNKGYYLKALDKHGRRLNKYKKR